MCCGSRSIYTWSDEWVADGGTGKEEEMAECIGLPTRTFPFNLFLFSDQIIAEKFETKDLKWSPDGKGLILLDKDMFCCAFEVEEELRNTNT
jgi:hypothetical protein